MAVRTHTKTKLTQNIDYFHLIFFKKLKGKRLKNNMYFNRLCDIIIVTLI